MVSSAAIILIVQPPFISGAPVSGEGKQRALGFMFCMLDTTVETLQCKFLSPRPGVRADTAPVLVMRMVGPGTNAVVITFAYGVVAVFVCPM